MKLNEILVNHDKTRQTRIIKHKGEYIARRILLYQTRFGPNSVGCEKNYSTFDLAVENEMKWLLNEK